MTGKITEDANGERIWVSIPSTLNGDIESTSTHPDYDLRIILSDNEVNKILESAVQPNQKPTVSQDQSRKAMQFTLDTQKNTMEGASRQDIGWIAFLWGNTGTAPLFADGDGLARIIAKQDFEKKYLPSERSGHELCLRLVDIVTRGYIKRKYGPTSRPKIDFSWQGEVATVSWEPARKTWYLSAWREDWGGVLESAATETPAIDVDELRVVVSIDNDQAPDIPKNWIVFNAPRPMYGDKEWQGDPGHGMLYVAVDPQGAGAEWMAKENKSLDGWIYQDISAATMTAMVRQNYLDGYFKNDAAKVDAAMAKISIEQIRGQFFNVLEKLNYGTFKALLAKATAPKPEVPDASDTSAPSGTIEQWRLDIRNAKTFQDIADVFAREFGVTVGEDDPVMETAILEDGCDWKTMLRDATTFDDIYLAFKASGVMSKDMPVTSQAAIAVFNHVDRLELLVSDYNVAGTSIQKFEISELIRKSMSKDSLITTDTLSRMVSGYENVKPESELSAEAGKEIFENVKAKGEELVTAWQADPEIIPAARQVSDKRAAIESLEKERSAVELNYRADKSTLEDRLGYTQKLDVYAREAHVAASYVADIADRKARARPQTEEWFKLQEAYSNMVAEVQEIHAKHLKILKEASDGVFASVEYLNLFSEYKAKEKVFADKKQQLNAELSDAIAKTYNPLIQKMLELSPITEKQAKEWASEQVIDKAVIKELAMETLVMGNSGARAEARYSEADIRKDMAELYRLSGGRFGKCHIQERFNGQPRACADPAKKVIHIGDEFTKRTLWHEMGHLVEADAKYISVSIAFLDGRVDKTKGLTKLSALTGNARYTDDEVAHTDHLFSAYVGKYYGGRGTEVLSMGIQQFSSPELMHELGLKDPEMFKMILGILATPPSGSEKERLTGELNQAKSEVDDQKAVDAFYKMLDKKIKKNPLFYEPFAYLRPYKVTSSGKRTSTAYCMVSNEVDSNGYSEFSFSAKTKALVLLLTYIYLAIRQLGDMAWAAEFKRYGQSDVINRRRLVSPPLTQIWGPDGIPDIYKAA